MSHQDIFHKIKALNLSEEARELLPVLDHYLDRVVYVKDYVGLRDFLFIAELEAKEFEFSIFSCIDVPINIDDNEENFLLLNDMMIYEPDDVVQSILEFFETTDRTLYVGIGFKESVLLQDDMFLVQDLIEKKEAVNAYDAFALVRRFPDWYVAVQPRDIHQRLRTVRLFKNANRLLLLKRKEDLAAEIDTALLNDDADQFQQLTRQLQLIEHDLQIEEVAESDDR